MLNEAMPRSIFKRCPVCGQIWRTREDLLSDPRVQLVGYQVNFENLVAGFFLFNHDCGDTFAVHVEQFVDLYDGPVFEERKTGSEECPGYCLHEGILDPCPAECECAFVREVIQIIREWPKEEGK